MTVTREKPDVRPLIPLGADVTDDGNVTFTVWAPRRHSVDVIFDERTPPLSLTRSTDGVFSGTANISAGQLYRFRLDNGDAFPDPMSRFQPQGPHGPSMVIDPSTFEWTDQMWTGPPVRPVLYELHVGTFTPEGTFASAARQLPYLADLGIDIVEIMPVADFPGRFGWGYDGVNFFAPSHLYGKPDDLRAFVDYAHSLGVGVILDVVYNHFGPDGNYLDQFAEEYFTAKHTTDWGAAINYYGPGSERVRAYFVANACYWVREFHMDGLRFDATQNIYDASTPHILGEITQAVKGSVNDRKLFNLAENESQEARVLQPVSAGGFGMDAVWNDDFHHAARVALTGWREAYYTDYCGTPQEMISATRWGYLYQGQYYQWQKKKRGEPALSTSATCFISFLENHDQVANSSGGARLHKQSDPGSLRALTALMLLGPASAMLFQGQEYNAPQPFLYFADHKPELAGAVRKGRAAFLEQFPSFAGASAQRQLAHPDDPDTFARSTLNPAERALQPGTLKLHRDLIALRKREPFASATRETIEGVVLSSHSFALRFLTPTGADALLLVNMGSETKLTPIPEPLLAPPAGARWALLWSSEDVHYEGAGQSPFIVDGAFHLSAHSAIVLEADA